MSMTIRQKPLSKREELVLRLREEEELSYPQIAAKLGVCVQRARGIYIEAKERMRDHDENQEDALSLLPGRAVNLLTDLELTNRAEVKAAVEGKRLRWWVRGKKLLWDGMVLRNFGWKSWLVLLEWTGLPLPQGGPADPSQDKEPEPKDPYRMNLGLSRRSPESFDSLTGLDALIAENLAKDSDD
jgi:hypothetical protein